MENSVTSLQNLIDFLKWISGELFTGRTTSGPVNSVGDFFLNTISLIAILLVIAVVVIFSITVYTRMRIHEIEKERKKKHAEHFITPPPVSAVAVNPRWEYIERLFDSHNQNEWRIAIIEADAMLDELTLALNLPGETMGDRLKNANPNRFPTVQSASEAHKVRNRIAHDGVNFHLSEREAQTVKRHYEFVFRHAGLI